MVAPAKGSIEFIPLNNAARTAANAWDPAKDEQAGLQCKGYGAAGVMRLPPVFTSPGKRHHSKGRDGLRNTNPDVAAPRKNLSGL